MKSETIKNLLLLTIVIALIANAAKPYRQPPPAEAQAVAAQPYYIEPGVQMLRRPDGNGQVYGRMIVDLRTGKIWGFPTNGIDPYPSNPLESKPMVSHPFALGKFAFEEMDR